jgi:NAD(P)-dependent dehydrogenase (short-subunit alcohol dehydrogenase family)
LPGSRCRPTGAYNLSKLANVLFTTELARRAAGITATAVSPGFVHTGLTREATGAYRAFFALVRPFQATPGQGATFHFTLAQRTPEAARSDA